MTEQDRPNPFSGDQVNDKSLNAVDYGTAVLVTDLSIQGFGTDAAREIHTVREKARREGEEAGYRRGYNDGKRAALAEAAKTPKKNKPRTSRRQQ